MAQYQGRRGPNVSQYIANLNTLPSPTDMNQHGDLFDFSGDDLNMFSTADFVDHDLNFDLSTFDAAQRPTSQEAVTTQPSFFHTFPQHPSSIYGGSSLPPSPPNGLPFAGQVQQSQPTVPSPHHFANTFPVNPAADVQTGTKRKAGADSIISVGELEEASRAVAEEDKRRRNTAASARFRVKKKQREQALEKTAKEMSDKVQILEARIGQLEMENQWLKGLITEKNVKLEGSPLKAKADKEAAAKEGKKAVDAEKEKRGDESREEAERSTPQKKRGVGTEVEAAKA